jgi:hypothetical protein
MLAGGYTVPVLVLEPCTVGVNEQRPVKAVTVHGIPHVRAIGSILVVLGVELGKEVVPLEGV